ncbi:MAG: tetratricopeptide repeat protein [Pseudomonadota bacterium]
MKLSTRVVRVALLSGVLLSLLEACSTGRSLPSAVVNDSATQAASTQPDLYPGRKPRVDQRAQQRFQMGVTAMAVQDWDTAEQDMQWLVQHYPRLSGPYLNLALIYKQQRSMNDAERYYQAALEVNSSNLEAYNHYALFLREAGRFPEAETVYLEALGVWPDHAETHRNLGVLYDLYYGNVERALVHYYRYQTLTGGESRQVASWIVDLERRSGQIVSRQLP